MIQEQPDTPFIKVNLKYEKNHIFQTENISFGYAYKFDNNPLPFGENRFRISYDFFKTSHNSERYNIEMLFYEGAFIGLSQQGLMIFLPKTFLQYLIWIRSRKILWVQKPVAKVQKTRLLNGFCEYLSLFLAIPALI